jgi:hypothetical protein
MTGSCTVAKYLIVLSHELTVYDQAQSRREAKRGIPNIYRLGLLLGAANKVWDDVQTVKDSSSPEALVTLRLALHKHFEHDFPPVKKVLKQIDAGTCKIK